MVGHVPALSRSQNPSSWPDSLPAVIVMDNVRPQDLPAFLDPLLDYLSEHLPSSLYDSLFTLLSYGLMLLSGLFSLVSALPSWKPWEWDAQKFLPPLIVFLTAYYSLLSLYRTTSFMVRMAFRLVKWVLILGALGAAAGWLAGTNGGRTGDLGGVLGGFWESLQGQGAPAASTRGRSTTNTRQRPRIYESFTAHEQQRYEYDEQRAGRNGQGDAASDAQRFIQSVAGFAGRAMGGTGFDILSNAKNFFDSLTSSAAGDTTNESSGAGGRTRKQPNRKSKASSRRKTASR